MSKYLLESTFALKTQIFQAKNILDAPVHPYFQGWLEIGLEQLSSIKLNVSFLNQCFWYNFFSSQFLSWSVFSQLIFTKNVKI